MSEHARFVNPLETVLYLKSLPVLQGLGYGELALIARRARERHFRRGELILRPDRAIDSFFIVVEGRVRVSRDGVREMTCQAGHNVGILHALAQIHHGVEAVAEEDTLALKIESHAMFEIFEDHFSILQNTIRNIGVTLTKILKETSDGTFRIIADREPLPGRPLDLVERIDRVRSGGIFHRVSFDALARLAMAVREVRFEPGDTIWKEGDPSGYLLNILSGEIECTFDEGQKSFRAGAGYPLGNVESVAEKPRWYEARATTPVVAFRADTEIFLDTMEDHFDLAMEFLQASARNILRYMAERAAAEQASIQEAS
jgi:CRP-like cAMP-binding protein